jgi:hypothetical protein
MENKKLNNLRTLVRKLIKEEFEKLTIDPKENLEYFLSFNNDYIYTKWINDEISDNEAISMVKDVDNVSYDPKVNYKAKYSGD